MIIQTISDTHNMHKDIALQDCDMIIHAGDFSYVGSAIEALDFLTWYISLPYKHKVLVPGNHDIWCERLGKEYFASVCKRHNIHLLIDSSVVVDGIKIWGSPVTLRYGYGWAWNRDKSQKHADERKIRGVTDAGFIGNHWDKIPNDVDIVVCHEPCYGILDSTPTNENAGCKLLKEKVLKVKPKLFVCGHFHEGRGIEKIEETTFVNTAICGRSNSEIREPFLFDYSKL